jgi:hypothetical protein
MIPNLQARRHPKEVPEHEDHDQHDDRRDDPWRLRGPLLEERFERWRRNLRVGGGTAAAITDERLIGDLGLAKATLQYGLLTETGKTEGTGSHGDNGGNGGNGEFS